MQQISFEDYYNQHRTIGEPDHSFISAAANVSTAALKRSQKIYGNAVAAKYDEKARLFAEYQDMLSHGEIAKPSRIDRLIQIAQGRDDLESTQAARRLLQKRNVDWSKA